MPQPDQQELLNALDQHQVAKKKLDRILMIVLPIIAFLISMICANWTWFSTLGTIIVLTLAFIAVGIQRWSITLWLAIIVVYCCIDNYFSYGTLVLSKLKMQALTMLIFTIIFHVARPYLDQVMQHSLIKKDR
ncbi:hypothetical protein P256_01966 [Acinetobacter nectaris CIP 110549]|uniref:Uncharacterized protein n=1 Tax=Acinetobacter nectaris CIP 110549 TaxID=1392540 RepID=V2TM48_9GAMM|nr:hypothetical protein [Acinetobacter nectaris]ESK38427.1 hypothetical protein P256_01966 [Acinetobacter nectaris CIP 110549]